MRQDIFDLQLSVGEKILRALRNGRPVPKALFREGISLPEPRTITRRQRFVDLGEVHAAILETNSVVTMFREDEAGSYHPTEAGGLRIGKRRPLQVNQFQLLAERGPQVPESR